ncbi:MAG: transporter substrate-binding domain-containing protein [Candidatus Promineifilaceae bacterium]|jgi:ABC-type amino acid transport substrate-binding protein
MKKKRLPALVLILFLLLGLLVACSTPEETPTSEPPTEEPAAPAATEPAATSAPIADDGELEAAPDQTWARIQSEGRMRVGTSADYPPFEFYTSDNQLDGFDIALIRAIGEELGVIVDITDITFDGLGDAMLADQVEVSIAALSITPEREAAVDFSNVYYIGEDAVLAADGSGITGIESEADIAPYTLGVQASSVYETWAREQLIDTGLMPAENLLVYATADQAVTDLVAGRVDLVMMDKKPAQVAEGLFDVSIIASDLHRQRFAIAIPQGEDTLRREINRALTNLQNEGFLADLAEQYLNLDELLPIEEVTPVPEEEQTVIVGCTDAMAFIGDLNLDDNNMSSPPVMSPGQAFRKGWRVKNIGTCTWNSGYSLNYVNGNVSAAQMGGSTVPVRGQVLPGQTYDFWADLVAPTLPGTYQGFWEMRNDQQEPFGQRVWVGIYVPAPPTPVPVPTQTPSPTISFSANRTTITEGDCVTFTWNVQNIQAVWFYPDGEDFNRYPTTGQNSSVECPNTTTTYNLRVLNTNGSVEIRQITIVVEPSNSAPKISSFTVSPPSVSAGQCVQISWRVEGNVSSVVISRDNIVLWNGAPLAGTTNDCPSNPGFAIYVIEASGPGGTARLQQNVSVN